MLQALRNPRVRLAGAVALAFLLLGVWWLTGRGPKPSNATPPTSNPTTGAAGGTPMAQAQVPPAVQAPAVVKLDPPPSSTEGGTRPAHPSKGGPAGGPPGSTAASGGASTSLVAHTDPAGILPEGEQRPSDAVAISHASAASGREPPPRDRKPPSDGPSGSRPSDPAPPVEKTPEYRDVPSGEGPAFVLDGIIYSITQRRGSAFIDGKRLLVGDEYKGWKVLEIRERAVILVQDDLRFTLTRR